MGSGARLRSANQAFGRSRSGAFLLSAPLPPGPEFPKAWIHPCHGTVRENGAPPFGTCQIERLCSNLPSPGPFTGDAFYIVDWCFFSTNLNPRHLPINLWINEGDAPFHVIPATDCADDEVFFGNQWLDGTVVYTLLNEDPQNEGPCPKPSGGVQNTDAAVFEFCSDGGISGFPAIGTIIGMELTEVRDIILEFDGAGNRFRVDPGLYYAPGDQVYLLGTGGNDGLALVTSYADPWVTVDRSLGQIPAAGASLLVAGRWNFCGTYGLLESPPFGLYEVLLYPGTGDSWDRITGTIKIFGAPVAAYNGFQTASPETACLCSRLTVLYEGDSLGGNWVNDTGIFNGDYTGWPAPLSHPVRIVSTNYSGEYPDGRTLSSTQVSVEGVFAEFDETGTIERQGVLFEITGGSGSRVVEVDIAGTGFYDGQTTCFLDAGAGTLRGNFLWFAGDATGTWTEIGGLGESGTITATLQGYPIVNFTSVEPEFGGEIIDIVSAVTRVNALAHGIDAFASTFFIWNLPHAPPLTPTIETTIRALIDGDLVDVEGRPPIGFNGQWTSGYF